MPSPPSSPTCLIWGASGGFDTQKEPVSLARLAKHAADGLSPQSRTQGAKICSQHPGEYAADLGERYSFAANERELD